MPERHLFEYAVIRLVPRVEREEFINVGVILYCAKKKYLRCVIRLNETRLTSLFPQADLPLLRSHLDAFSRICCASASGGPISLLEPPSRFRWLTAKRSTMVQTSAVHPGMSDEPEKMLERLLTETVL